jgi:hypothetical protein
MRKGAACGPPRHLCEISKASAGADVKSKCEKILTQGERKMHTYTVI